MDGTESGLMVKSSRWCMELKRGTDRPSEWEKRVQCWEWKTNAADAEIKTEPAENNSNSLSLCPNVTWSSECFLKLSYIVKKVRSPSLNHKKNESENVLHDDKPTYVGNQKEIRLLPTQDLSQLMYKCKH